MWQGEFTFTPRKPVDLRFTYYKMSAFHPFPGDPRIFADGTSRGHHYQVRADFALHRTLKGHVLWEHLLPGAYYRAKSPASFLRFELIFAVRGEARL